MTRKRITLTNNFHNTEVELLAEMRATGRLYLSERQTRKARAALCGASDCTCGDTAGARPGQVTPLGYNHGVELES